MLHFESSMGNPMNQSRVITGSRGPKPTPVVFRHGGAAEVAQLGSHKECPESEDQDLDQQTRRPDSPSVDLSGHPFLKPQPASLSVLNA